MMIVVRLLQQLRATRRRARCCIAPAELRAAHLSLGGGEVYATSLWTVRIDPDGVLASASSMRFACRFVGVPVKTMGPTVRLLNP